MSHQTSAPQPSSANDDDDPSPRHSPAGPHIRPAHWNPFWTLVILSGFAFAATCLVAVVGEFRRESPLNRLFDTLGTELIVAEAACLILFGLMAMTLDRLQTLKMLRNRDGRPDRNDEKS